MRTFDQNRRVKSAKVPSSVDLCIRLSKYVEIAGLKLGQTGKFIEIPDE
jgi:hypothetical protein